MNKFYSIAILFTLAFVALSGFYSQTHAQTATRSVYSDNFTSDTWVKTSTTGDKWEVNSGVLQLEKKGEKDIAGTAYAVSPQTYLYANVKYTVSFDYANAQPTPLQFFINLGSDTVAIHTYSGYVSATSYSFDYTPTQSGNYKIGLGISSFKRKVFIQVDNVKITTPEVYTYYNKSSKLTTLGTLGSWGSAEDGTGLPPLDFSDDNQTFYLHNYTGSPNIVLDKNIQLGVNSNTKVVLGKGTSDKAINLKLSNGNTITGGKIDVAAFATLDVGTNQRPNFNNISPNSTVIFSGNNSHIIPDNVEFGTVIIRAKVNGNTPNKFSNDVKIKGKLKVEDTELELTKGKQLEIGNNGLELDHTSKILNGSVDSYITLTGQGQIKKGIAANGSAQIPIGTAAGGYSPVTVTNSNTTVATVNVSVKDSDLSAAEAKTAANKTVKPIMSRTWNISAPEGANTSVTLEWMATTDADKLLVNGDEVHLMQFNGTSWEIAKEFLEVTKSGEVLSVTYSYNPADITPQSSLRVTTTQQAVAAPLGTTEDTPRAGDVTVGSDMSVLPVDLLSFTAKVSERGAVVLNWATAQEKNNAYFEVQRSHDGKSFAAIGRRQGRGTTAIRANYSYTDTLPQAGTSYYRLRQVDTDGTFKILPTVVVNLKQGTAPQMTLYPNPSEGQNVRLKVQGLPAGEEVKVLVADMMGKIVLRKELPANGAVLIPATRLKPGMYIVTARSKTMLITQKLSIK